MSIVAFLVAGLLTAPGCYPPPVTARVVDPYREPACDYCPGNRGIEYAPDHGTAVRAVAAGRVSFAGSVAGVHYVVVAGLDGVRIGYGMLSRAAVATGADVHVGELLGATTDRFFLSMRVGDRYVDPAPHLGRLRTRARLLPLDGAVPRPARVVGVACRR